MYLLVPCGNVSQDMYYLGDIAVKLPLSLLVALALALASASTSSVTTLLLAQLLQARAADLLLH